MHFAKKCLLTVCGNYTFGLSMFWKKTTLQSDILSAKRNKPKIRSKSRQKNMFLWVKYIETEETIQIRKQR